jgi:hypothetical protein
MYFYLLSAFAAAAVVCLILSMVLKKTGRRLPFLFYGGLSYILVALPLAGSWYLYFAIGIIVVGAAFMALSRFKIPTVLQATVVVLPVLGLFGYMWKSESSKNIFLIPEGYRGRVVVVHGCSDGAPREFENFYRVYKIGANGLLKSRFNFAGNAFDSLHSKYFYVNEQGHRTPIAENAATDTVGVQGLWTLDTERKGETQIDFIVDKLVNDAHQYKSQDKDQWQREIDSCAK